MNKQYCPAIFLTAPASGQGKTTVTAALARLLSRQGKVVRVFKTGPDYLDPLILEQASGQPVEQLDLWMAGDAWCQNKLYKAALVADLIIVEGAMGMFDGEPSSADLAARFNLPMVIVMDVKGMAQTAAAIAAGLAQYRKDIAVVGLIANHCGSERHRQLIEEALPESLPLLASLNRSENIALPERHLGLVQPQEIRHELEARFNAGADWLAQSFIARAQGADAHVVDSINTNSRHDQPQQLCTAVDAWLSSLIPVEFTEQSLPVVPKLLSGKTIAVAKDDAFSFIYESNVTFLQNMGASICFFSPMRDEQVPPAADALWLAGGYPELHAQELAASHAALQSIRSFHQQGKPILAECGGFLYCLEKLTDLSDTDYPMLGVIPGKGVMRGKRGCQGMQTAPLPEGHIRGHAHHRSRSEDTPTPIAYGVRQRHVAPGEAIFRVGSLTASYLHLFFPSNPEAIAKLFLGEHKSSAVELKTNNAA